MGLLKQTMNLNMPDNADSGIGAKITKKRLTLKASDFTVRSKTYNGDNVAIVTVAQGNQKGLDGVRVGEDVVLYVLNGAFVYEDSDAGKDKKLLLTGTDKFRLGGRYKDNYTLSSYAKNTDIGLTATVDQKKVTLNINDLEVTPRGFISGNKSATVVVKSGTTAINTGGVLNADKDKVSVSVGSAFEFDSPTVGDK